MKELILKVVVWLAIINGLSELAMSQIHIVAITKLFAREIGVYLFLFIIFGLTTSFNAFSLKTWKSIILFIATSLLASAAGFVYLNLMQADVAAQNSLSMADVQTSWQLMIASIVIYLVGLIVVPILSWGNIETAEV